ncbi:hypothetical protein DLM78_19635 [Leptospira stimsonii]|uniref:Uncharacterized protein n=1 Tax=Leptospira stimsonii TaxID=2202203 RepID=A0A8B3CKF9_9LEPT|nr:hypothetical protein DLM78_19635 [Leptospira stimsonii]
MLFSFLLQRKLDPTCLGAGVFSCEQGKIPKKELRKRKLARGIKARKKFNCMKKARPNRKMTEPKRVWVT